MSDKITEPWKWGDENQPKPEEAPHILGKRHLCCGFDAEMRPFAQGNWVAYEDYARLKTENEALRKELAEAQENYHLVNEMVARLRKEAKS